MVRLRKLVNIVWEKGYANTRWGEWGRAPGCKYERQFPNSIHWKSLEVMNPCSTRGLGFEMPFLAKRRKDSLEKWFQVWGRRSLSEPGTSFFVPETKKRVKTDGDTSKDTETRSMEFLWPNQEQGERRIAWMQDIRTQWIRDYTGTQNQTRTGCAEKESANEHQFIPAEKLQIKNLHL